MIMMNSAIISLSSVSAARSSSRSFLQSPLRQQGKDATKNILHRHNFSSSAQSTTSGGSSTGSNNTIGKIFFPSLCAITFTLGTWQTQRYFEKVDMVQKRKDDLSLDPLSFDQWRLLNHDNHVGASPSSSSSGSNGEEASKSYRRVIIQGKFDHTNSILIGPRGPPPGALATSGPNSGLGGGGGGMSSSLQGYWVITPLIVGEEEENRLDDGGSLSMQDVSSRKEGWLGRLLPWRRRNNNKSNNTSDQLSHDLRSGSSDTNSTISTKKQSSSDKQTTTVWINRGWIPRHYINPNTNQILQSWDEPKEHVTVLSMESQTEKGRGMFTPPSRVDPVVGGKGEGGSNNTNGTGVGNDENTIKKLLWMDRETMEEMTNCSTNDHPPLFVQINTTSATDDNNNMKKTESKTFPVQPSEEYVGEFKVTPDVHMGYAITWFGLSGAGVIMTRKLLTRGR